MNIAYIMRYWPVYGGGETITVSLANELVARGHKVHVFYSIENRVEHMPYVVDERVKEHKLNTIYPFSADDVSRFRKCLEDNDIDIMVNQWASTSLCDKARKKTKVKLVTCWHLNVLRDMKPVTKKERFVSLFGNRFFSKYSKKRQMDAHLHNQNHSDKYVFLSRAFEMEFKQLAGKKANCSKLASIPNPLTYELDYDWDNYAGKRKEVLFVGRIFECHKRLSYVLRIWKGIENRPDCSDWTLNIVGNGPDMDKMQKMSKDLRLKRVSFEGFRNPRPYYERSSIFVMTSAFEGFGMTLVEAQQYAVVPIAMDSYGSLHDILVNDDNGIIVPNDAIDLYTEKLSSLMKDDELRQKLAKRGLESCSKFKISTIVNQWESLFNNLV